MKNIKIITIMILTTLTLSTMSSCADINEETKPIKGLKLTSGANGSSSGAFVLGVGVYHSGSTTETKYYFYYFRNEGFVLHELRASKVEIVETDDIEPSIKGKFYPDGRPHNILDDFVIYVPIGTIFEEYTIVLP